MEVFAECSNQQLCPCYKEYQEFQKVVELNDSGLEIYYHRICTDNIGQSEMIESPVNRSRDVFILHNKKDEKLITSQLTSELENKYIRCSRCRNIFEHAQELLQELKSIDRKIVMGICDYCCKKALVRTKLFCVCDKIVQIFKSSKAAQMEDTEKYDEIWPLKKEHVLKDKQKEIRAYSNLQINRDLNSPLAGNEPEAQQIYYLVTNFFYDETKSSGTGSKAGYIRKSSVQPIKSKKTTFDDTPQEGKIINMEKLGTSSVGSDTNMVETYVGVKELPKPSIKRRKQEKVFADTPSMDAKEELKRRHDLSLRHMLRLEKDSKISVPKRPDVYPTSTVTPLEQKEPISINHMESEMNMKKIPKRKPHDLGFRGELHDLEEKTKDGKNLKDSSLATDVELGPSVDKVKKLKERGIKSKSRSMQTQFSYIFPKAKDKKVRSISVKSSQLIKETQEKLRLQSESKKKRKNQGDQQNLEQESKIKLSQEKNKLQAKAKKEDKLKANEEDKLKAKEEDELKARKEDELESEGGEKISAKNKEKAKSEEGKKLKTKKGEKGEKSQRGKQEGKEILKLSENIRNKKLQTEKEKIKQEELTLDIQDKKSKKISGKKKEGKSSPESLKERKEREQFKKLQAKHSIAKEEALKKKLELEAQKASQEAVRKLKMCNKRIKQVKSDDYLKLVKIKQSKKISPEDIDYEMIRAHTAHLNRGRKLLRCPLCWDSELELEVYRLNNQKYLKKDEITKIIIGEKIYKCKPHLEKTKKPEVIPLFFKKDIFLKEPNEKVSIIAQQPGPVPKNILAANLLKKDEKENELDLGKGIVRYALSDRSFIEKGWTVLPTEKVVRMMNVYRMRPAHPEFDWFEHNKNKQLMTYDTGERLAEFDDNGRGRWYYKSGRLALDYYDAEETNAKQRFVIYSSGEPDERGRTHPITVLATFDYLGNGIVFDHAGKIRLKYNQSEGVVLDRSIGPVSHWKWHTLNDPPVLQQVMIDTQLPQKDPEILKLGSSEDKDITRLDNEEMLAIEFDNFIKDKTKKLSQKLEHFQIKMKALKINEHFSLKVLDQATVYLIFRDGLTNLKVNMGMIIDHKEIVDTETAEVGKVSNSLERFPARSDSLAGLQRSVTHAQRYERQHAERERRLRHLEPRISADLLTAAASPPMRLPLRTVPTVSTSTSRYCSRKPSNNLYYDTRLFC